MRSLLFFLLFTTVACTDEPPRDFSWVEKPAPEPRVYLPGVLSTQNFDEFGMAFHPQQATLYFSRRKPGEKQKIYQIDYADGSWSAAKLLPFSTDRDETPFVTPDGTTLFFGSERPIPGKPNAGNFDVNVWRTELQADGNWGTPQPLPEPINDVQRAGEQWPLENANSVFSIDGKTFYYTVQKRGRTTIELYRFERNGDQFGTPQRIDGLFADSTRSVYNASLSPDGNYLVFNSYGGADGAGGEDLYYSTKTDTGWSLAQPLNVNSKLEEGGPLFSPDGKYFFFTRAEFDENYEQVGTWDIWVVETASLNLAE